MAHVYLASQQIRLYDQLIGRVPGIRPTESPPPSSFGGLSPGLTARAFFRSDFPFDAEAAAVLQSKAFRGPGRGGMSESPGCHPSESLRTLWPAAAISSLAARPERSDMKTFSAKPAEVKRDWFVIDASDKVLGLSLIHI